MAVFLYMVGQRKTAGEKFLRFLFSHTIYILFFVGIGTNSSFNCIPNPCASFFTILRLGFLVPFSIRLISACVIPVLADKSFCVIFCLYLRILQCSFFIIFIATHCHTSVHNLLYTSLPVLFMPLVSSAIFL